MPGFTAMEIIDRPPSEVFTYLSDPTCFQEWVDGMISVEMITKGGLRIGSKWKETRRLGDKEADSVIEVISYRAPTKDKRPPYAIAFRAVHMGIRATYHYSLEAEGEDHTLIEITVVIEGNNLITRLLSPWFASTIKKQDGNQLKELKHAVEANRWYFKNVTVA